jgi:hypothetical protein
MRMTTALLGIVTATALLGANAALAQGALPATLHEEAEITINKGASGDGFLRVAIQPQTGTKHEATIAISKTMGENEIAKKIAEALTPAIAPDYVIDKDAGEHVKIKKSKREVASFSIEITFSAPGFSIVLDH